MCINGADEGQNLNNCCLRMSTQKQSESMQLNSSHSPCCRSGGWLSLELEGTKLRLSLDVESTSHEPDSGVEGTRYELRTKGRIA